MELTTGLEPLQQPRVHGLQELGGRAGPVRQGGAIQHHAEAGKRANLCYLAGEGGDWWVMSVAERDRFLARFGEAIDKVRPSVKNALSASAINS